MDRIVRSLAALAFASLPVVAVAGDPGVRHRPIEEFVEAQGTYCVNAAACTLFEPPVGNVLGFISIQDGVRYLAKVDYAGLANAWAGGAFGTTFDGDITERELPDGTAHVKITLHTRNALAWVTGRLPASGGGWGPLFHVFGHTAPQVVAGELPAFGDVLFTLDYVAPYAGAPIPDLTRFWFDGTYAGYRTREAVHSRAAGWMDDGAPGELVLQLTGLLDVYGRVMANHDGEPPTAHGIWEDGGWVGAGVELRLIGR
jgi:hypothetical protein